MSCAVAQLVVAQHSDPQAASYSGQGMLQTSWLCAHWHVPVAQIIPIVGQTCPQVPQFEVSVWVSTHVATQSAPPSLQIWQTVWFCGHVHWPEVQA